MNFEQLQDKATRYLQAAALVGLPEAQTKMVSELLGGLQNYHQQLTEVTEQRDLARGVIAQLTDTLVSRTEVGIPNPPKDLDPEPWRCNDRSGNYCYRAFRDNHTLIFAPGMKYEQDPAKYDSAN